MLPSVVSSSFLRSVKLSLTFAAKALMMPRRIRSCMTLSRSLETLPAAFSKLKARGSPLLVSRFSCKFFLDISFDPRSFLFRKNPFPAAAFYRHLIFRNVEFDDDTGRGTVKRNGRLSPRRLKKERRAFSGYLRFCRSCRGGINADVLVQNFRADRDRLECGYLKRLVVVNVDDAGDDIFYRVNFRVRGVGECQPFLRQVSQPCAVVVGTAGVPVERFAVPDERLHSDPFPIPHRSHQLETLFRNDMAVEQRFNKFRQVVRRRNDRARTKKIAWMRFGYRFPAVTEVHISKSFVPTHVDISGRGVSIPKADL